MHVRRGDYVSDLKASNMLGALSLDYYHNAAQYVAARVANPTFFVFTDDPVWAKEHIRIDHPVIFVMHNRSNKAYLDMHLMSICRHNIIANSTFSWWGAWLNRNADKIIVAPRTWYRDTSYDTTDLIPEAWVRINGSFL